MFQLGVALGFVLPPMLVDANGTAEEMAADFRLMFYLVAGFTSVLFVFILLCKLFLLINQIIN